MRHKQYDGQSLLRGTGRNSTSSHGSNCPACSCPLSLYPFCDWVCMCMVVEKWELGVTSLKTCCNAGVFMAWCSGAAPAAAQTLLPMMGTVQPWAPIMLGGECDCFSQVASVSKKEKKWQEVWESSSGDTASVRSYSPANLCPPSTRTHPIREHKYSQQ